MLLFGTAILGLACRRRMSQSRGFCGAWAFATAGSSARAHAQVLDLLFPLTNHYADCATGETPQECGLVPLVLVGILDRGNVVLAGWTAAWRFLRTRPARSA